MRFVALLVIAVATAGFLTGCGAGQEVPVKEAADVEEVEPPGTTIEETTAEETTVLESTTNSEVGQSEQMNASSEEKEAVGERDRAQAEPPGISTTQTAAPNPAIVGQPLTLAITVKNNSVPQHTALIDFLPSGVSFVSASPSQGSCDAGHHGGNAVACSLGVVPSGSSATIKILVTPTVPSTMTNTAVGGGEFVPQNPNTSTIVVNPTPESGTPAPETGTSEAHGAH